MIFIAVMKIVLRYQHVEPLGFRRSTAVGFCLTYAELQERTFFGEASRVVDGIYQTMFWSRARMGSITCTLASSESVVASEVCEVDCNEFLAAVPLGWPQNDIIGRPLKRYRSSNSPLVDLGSRTRRHTPRARLAESR